jgi:hypothetical protein
MAVAASPVKRRVSGTEIAAIDASSIIRRDLYES